MSSQTYISKLLSFFLIKIVIGIAVVGGSVVLAEWFGQLLLGKTQWPDPYKNFIIAVLDSLAALTTYIFLFRFYEKRRIEELNASTFFKNAGIGFITGFLLQSLFIAVIFLAGKYSIIQINAASFLLPSFTTALSAGFVAEILIRGIFFRLTEERLGTLPALFILVLIFVWIHSKTEGATLLSVSSTAIEAGLLLSAAYKFSKSLWLPIFLHFAWDFTEPGIFGGINPGNTVDKSLFTSEISGSSLFTGGQMGPQNSIQSLLLCSATAFLFLWLAKRKNNFVKPFWKK